MRDDLGFSQQVAQNTGDTVQIAAEIFTLGAAAKGIGAIGKVSKSAFKARFGENLSSAYSSKKVASASTSGASVSKNIDNIISEAERKGFRGVRGQIELHTPKGFGRNKDMIINGRNYWEHVLDRMQDRSIPFPVVEDCIKHGKIVPSTKQVSRLEHYDAVNNIKVITDKNTGDVISVIFGGKK